MAHTDIIFGLKPIQEALDQQRSINRIYLAKESRASGCNAIVDEAKSRSIPFDFVPQAKLNDLTQTRDHQGIAAKVSPIEYTTLQAFLNADAETMTLVILDQIHHPKNLGMIIRTAVGAGASGIMLTARKGALIDESVVRASTGTVYNVPILVEKNVAQAVKKLKEAGFWVYGLDAAGASSIFDINWPKKTALILGNETKGLRPNIAKQCDDLVSIPLQNNLDSLNVAVTAGIALFQIRPEK